MTSSRREMLRWAAWVRLGSCVVRGWIGAGAGGEKKLRTNLSRYSVKASTSASTSSTSTFWRPKRRSTCPKASTCSSPMARANNGRCARTGAPSRLRLQPAPDGRHRPGHGSTPRSRCSGRRSRTRSSSRRWAATGWSTPKARSRPPGGGQVGRAAGRLERVDPSMEDIGKASSGPKWFQIYLNCRYRAVEGDPPARPAAGFKAVILTSTRSARDSSDEYVRLGRNRPWLPYGNFPDRERQRLQDGPVLGRSRVHARRPAGCP